MKGQEEENGKTKQWGWMLIVFGIGFLVVVAALFTLFKDWSHWKKKDPAPGHHHGGIDKKYADALEIALQFFDVQKSGKLVNNRIAWRGDSGLQDGSEVNLDLTKGMYDAGDLVKFGFPMAFTATVLSWAILEYGHNMDAVKQLGYVQDSLKWITDFLINAHPSANVLYVQVGDPEIDHNCWVRPETMSEARPATQVNASFPGTEVAAETAAAMASASLVFKKIDSSYSDLLILHARQLFSFADTYRRSYSVSIPQAQKYYNSTAYGDELLWAATWLYLATKDQLYLKFVTDLHGSEFANWDNPSWFSWDDKHAGVQVLVARLDILGEEGMTSEENMYLQKYWKTAKEFMCQLLPDSPTVTSSRTESGLIWVLESNPLQYAVASAFLAVLFGDYMKASQVSTLYCDGNYYEPADLRKFAIAQVDYILGNNPMKMSYLVGYESSYPQHIHHRGSSIPLDATTGCRDGFIWLYTTDPNPNLAVGALVGGPSRNETYNDIRNNSLQGEPTTYNSALLVGLLSALLTNSSVPQSLS